MSDCGKHISCGRCLEELCVWLDGNCVPYEYGRIPPCPLTSTTEAHLSTSERLVTTTSAAEMAIGSQIALALGIIGAAAAALFALWKWGGAIHRAFPCRPDPPNEENRCWEDCEAGENEEEGGGEPPPPPSPVNPPLYQDPMYIHREHDNREADPPTPPPPRPRVVAKRPRGRPPKSRGSAARGSRRSARSREEPVVGDLLG